MYHNILAAVNEHSNSEVAARYAIHLARSCSARLTLMFVAGSHVGLEVIRQAEAALERLFVEAGARQVQVETIIQKGDPLRQISAVVREKAVDLVFSATRREDGKRRYFARTLSRQLMLQLPCSVALVRVVHPGKFFPQKILVPFRGRPALQDEKAFFVARLAAAFGAQVTLFHAPESLAGFFRGAHHYHRRCHAASAAGDRAVQPIPGRTPHPFPKAAGLWSARPGHHRGSRHSP